MSEKRHKNGPPARLGRLVVLLAFVILVAVIYLLSPSSPLRAAPKLALLGGPTEVGGVIDTDTAPSEPVTVQLSNGIPPQVISFAPLSNTHTAPLTTTVSITYDQDMDPATVSSQTFAVHAMQTGLLTQTYGVDGGTISLTPTQPFKPGELVQTSATTGTLSLSGQEPISPTVWQFRAAVGSSSGDFTDSGQLLALTASMDVALGDVDGDGDLDAFVGNAGANKVWLNDGGVQGGTLGNFSDSGQSLGSSDSQAVALGDMDGDGDLDAFVGNQGGMIDLHNGVWLNDGTGSFSDSGQSLGNLESWAVALGDVDGDGDLDAFVGNLGRANKVWLNDGTGNFSDSGQSLGSSTSMAVALGDVDGDGDLDAFAANYNQANKVWLNDGTGTFSDSGQNLGGSGSEGMALGDVDGDGDLDAFVGNWNGQPSKVWLNDGTGTFTDSGQSLGSSNSRTVALGDVDGDGDLDAFVGNQKANKVWLNDGTGTFSDSGQSLGNSNSHGVALGDVDGDGDLDAFVGNWGGRNKVWLNVDQTPPTDPSSLTSPSHTTSQASNDNTVDVTWSDDAADNEGGSGLAGFSTLWDTNSDTTPDEVVDHGPTVTSETSPVLDDGDSHYFHLRTCDNVGNCTNTLHLGPFILDTTSPSSSVADLPTYQSTLSFPVSWSGSDTASGIASYDVQVRSGVSWEDWQVNTIATSTAFAGEDGHTYYFQSRATDNAVNIESYPGGDGDTHTTVDVTPPSSSITNLSQIWASSSAGMGALSSSTVQVAVEWEGSDDVSGVKWYDIQYKQGSGGTWTDWLTGTTQASATLHATSTYTYYFQSRAQDHAGNWEDYPGGDGDAHICALFGDFDDSGRVDVADIQQVASRWRMTDDDPDWQACYDLNGDGIITVVDIMLVAANWGETCE